MKSPLFVISLMILALVVGLFVGSLCMTALLNSGTNDEPPSDDIDE